MQDTIQDAIDREDDDDDNEDQVSCLVDFIQSRNNTDAFADCASSLRGVNEGDDIRSCPVGCDDAFAELDDDCKDRITDDGAGRPYRQIFDECGIDYDGDDDEDNGSDSANLVRCKAQPCCTPDLLLVCNASSYPLHNALSMSWLPVLIDLKSTQLYSASSTPAAPLQLLPL